MVEHIIEQTAQKVKENQNLQNTDYLDAEGLCWCGICGERKENRYKILGHERILPCLCRCDREKLEAQKEEERKQDFAIKVSNLKSVGLTEPRFREWRFENDNGSTPKLDIARQYVENWKDMQQRNIGYVLMGPVGTGKSFFAGCVANRLMEQGIPVMMTNFSRILNELTKPYADKNEFISHLVSYPLLIIDDLGIERKPYLFHHFFQLFYILRCGSTYGVCNFGKLVDVHTNLVHFLIHCFQISGICIDNHAINRHLTEIDTHIRGLG